MMSFWSLSLGHMLQHHTPVLANSAFWLWVPCWPSSLVPLQACTEALEPPRKKGRASADHGGGSTGNALSPRGCIQAAHAVVQGVLAVAGDAARLLQWECHTPAGVATFDLAVAMLTWAEELSQSSAGGTRTHAQLSCHDFPQTWGIT